MTPASTVSIHAPAMEGDGRSPWMTSQAMFRSTPPHGGDPEHGGQVTVPMFRSTPPHGGDTRSFSSSQRPGYVSIHAPAWRATRRYGLRASSKCFDPRPRMGATRDVAVTATTARFRSTPPHGGRHGGRHRQVADEFRSTPPRWRATGAVPLPDVLEQFRSTPPHGGRPRHGYRFISHNEIHICIANHKQFSAFGRLPLADRS